MHEEEGRSEREDLRGVTESISFDSISAFSILILTIRTVRVHVARVPSKLRLRLAWSLASSAGEGPRSRAVA